MNARVTVPERDFQAAVIELADRCGFKVAHFHDSRRQVAPGRLVGDHAAAGFPDLVLCRGSRLLFVELKAETGRVRSSQKAWLVALREVERDAAGRVLVRMWRPSDWLEITQTLALEDAPA